MILCLLWSLFFWHPIYCGTIYLARAFFKKKKKENNYSTLFLFQMASIISLILLQMLYENFRMWANNGEMKLMKVSFQLIIHNVEINIFCVSTQCNAECKACIWSFDCTKWCALCQSFWLQVMSHVSMSRGQGEAIILSAQYTRGPYSRTRVKTLIFSP